MSFKIATWNVNSLKVRLPHVLHWLSEAQPDILGLQETKTLDSDFPFREINEAGYEVIYSGQKTYNGVALLSRRLPLLDIRMEIPGLVDTQRRVIAATVGKVRVLNLYIPNGESVLSPKYQYKLDWLQKLQELVRQERAIYPNMVILGDFNIALEPRDVYDYTACEGNVLFTERERIAFRNILSLGFVDCFRLFSQPEKSFSWWDYRMNAFKRNVGLRIDYILSSRELSENCSSCHIDKAVRAWERPSDHTPVMAQFEFDC